jgi:hypothetical protein
VGLEVCRVKMWRVGKDEADEAEKGFGRGLRPAGVAAGRIQVSVLLTL